MKIVIVGAGKVGYARAEQLCRENHAVTVIDSSEDAIRRVCDTLDVMGFKGNGVDISTLTEAGAPEADLLVAATNMDELNMACCLTAKNLGTRYTIARVRNPEYYANMGQPLQQVR